jgi:tellurite resistance protein
MGQSLHLWWIQILNAPFVTNEVDYSIGQWQRFDALVESLTIWHGLVSNPGVLQLSAERAGQGWAEKSISPAGHSIALDPPRRRMSASSGRADSVDDRMAVFEDEADVNDWVEIFWGCFLVALGLHRIAEPGVLLDPGAMRFIAGAVTALGLAWIGHGLKDMVVKEMRTSMVMLENSSGAAGSEGAAKKVDYGLIRDVLLHPTEYKEFLMYAYEAAFEDGILTEQEHEELQQIAAALNLSKPEVASIATRAAINSAIADGHVSEAELQLIRGAAAPLGLSDSDLARIEEALEDHVLTDDEKGMLSSMLENLGEEE